MGKTACLENHFSKSFFPVVHSKRVNIVGSLCDQACSASDRQGSNFESCVFRSVSVENGFSGTPAYVLNVTLHHETLAMNSITCLYVIF